MLKIEVRFDKEHPEYQKHLNVVKFCKENGVSVPWETEAFFAGPRLSGVPVDVKSPDFIIANVVDGFVLEMPISGDDNERRIRVSEIPAGADEIIVTALP